MEQKKTLWIIAAVGLFLIVVFGAAYLLLDNSGNKYEGTTTTITPSDRRNFDNGWSSPSDVSKTPVETSTTDSNNPDFQTANDLFVVANNATVVGLNNASEGTTIDLFTLNKDGQNTPNAVVTNKAPESPVTVPGDAEPKVTNEATEYYTGNPVQAETKEKANAVKKTSTETKVTSTASTKKPAAVSSKPVTSKPASVKTNTASKSTPTTRYWVQVASYQNKKTAENARTVLNDNKILSDIFTYEDNANKLFYRVRVGPYTTKSEAEYWMSKILQIKDFANAQSYVTSTVDK